MIAGFVVSALVQGALAVALASVVLHFVPARNATTRCAVWFAALLALVAAPALTVAVHFGVHPVLPSHAPAGAGRGAFSFVALRPVADGAARWVAWPFLLGTAANAAIALVWLGGTGVGIARLVASFACIRRIRRTASIVSHVDGVPVFAAPNLRIPIATGVFDPAIVLPATLVPTLSSGDLRCTLEHELAHVRRGDVAANALQRIVEALLFWNPWAYLVGRRIAAEREAACDDVAVDRLGGDADYARALAALGRLLNAGSSPLLTPSAFGSRNGLVARIERLTTGAPADTKLNYVILGGSTVLFSVLAVTAASLAASPAQTGAAMHQPVRIVAAASCKDPNAEAKAIAPVAPDLPKSQWPSHAVTALVRVTVASSGKATAASIYRSSGDPNVDRAVVTAAEKSTYSPKLVNCTPVASSYLFKAKFGP